MQRLRWTPPLPRRTGAVTDAARTTGDHLRHNARTMNTATPMWLPCQAPGKEGFRGVVPGRRPNRSSFRKPVPNPVKRGVIRTVAATTLERTPEPFSQQPPQRAVPLRSNVKDSRKSMNIRRISILLREAVCRR